MTERRDNSNRHNEMMQRGSLVLALGGFGPDFDPSRAPSMVGIQSRLTAIAAAHNPSEDLQAKARFWASADMFVKTGAWVHEVREEQI